ncbi:hypothetical protein GCM10010472_73500 [Pseudonocardia halophobica]|uniref:Uncharacterized protein n=1 Tax=Pseudonocardia halophobica TaxID=29401 RepID=A0A9W6P1L4_9PSEU|nr:hypothetical protein GCM10017577_73240 [Pseudonocardia halophobica]
MTRTGPIAAADSNLVPLETDYVICINGERMAVVTLYRSIVRLIGRPPAPATGRVWPGCGHGPQRRRRRAARHALR